ncbi:cobalt ABC transporter [Acidipropionibacterium jensenii]|uniref:cobalt ABC transporter n=1 Tax=Acidipropionibacterium jensenii TaxID=1749 RepID=UPI001E4DDC24|nr:cobalt ABC transporter [Acidipropionibacterium jensenii]
MRPHQAADRPPARSPHGPAETFSPGEADPIVDRIAADGAGRRPVVLIDGGSGSGKSTLAEALVGILDRRPGAPWQLVHDDFYPGWAGLSAAWRMVPEKILADHDAGYRPWDWAAKAPGDRRELDPRAAILVECCGALTPVSAAMATTRIWCEADPRTRRRRALDRDGEMFAPYWQMWAVQEELHWLRHRPRTLADIVVG